MRTRWAVIAALALAGLTACKDKGAFEIKRDVKRESKKTTGVPSEIMGSIGDAKPSLSITGASGAIADAIKRTLEADPIARRGAIAVDVKLAPAEPAGSGTLDATLSVNALFAHPPQLSRLAGTLTVHVTYSNASTGQLGQELGEAITSWLADEKLPDNLGVPSGTVPRVTRVVAGPPNCTLHEDGSVRCWDLGSTEAVPISKANGSIAISAANNFGACGVRKDGKAWCLDAWNNTAALEVREVCGVSGAVEISVGQATACALLGDGTVRCWPREEASYEPCSGATSSTEIAGLADAVSIDIGPFDGCAVTKDGNVSCWEHCGNDCKSGVQGRIDPRVPPRAAVVKGIAKAKQVLHAFQPCAWIGDDRVVCTKAGDRKASDMVVPEPIEKLVRTRAGVCALTTAGNLMCATGSTPFEKQGVSDLVDVGGGIAGMCGVTSKNEVSCWGGMSGSDPVRPVALSY